MAVMKIYAGTSTPLTELPSPVSVTVTREQIWSENTGRAQSGSNQAEMIGTAVANKKTYAIKWGILSSTDLNKIINNMPKGFFYFGMATSPSDSSVTSPAKFYRSELTYDVIQAADGVYYKDAQVSVIEK